MDPKVWGSVAVWFAASVGLVTLVSVLYREHLLKWLTRPEIILNFDMSNDGFIEQHSTRFQNGKTDPGPSKWARIAVTNRIGRRLAKNCRGYFVGLRVILRDGTTHEHPRHDVRQLFWMHGNYTPESRDLLPGIPHHLDLIGIGKNWPQVSLQGFPAYVWEFPGRYLFTAFVGAEDARPVGIQVSFEFDGTYESLRAVGYRLLTVPELEPGGDVTSASKTRASETSRRSGRPHGDS
jgi:hypothetical protein